MTATDQKTYREEDNPCETVLLVIGLHEEMTGERIADATNSPSG